MFLVGAVLNEIAPAATKGWVALIIRDRAPLQPEIRVNRNDERVYVPVEGTQRAYSWSRTKHSLQIIWYLLPILW